VQGLDGLRAGMRRAIEESLEPGEEIVGVWATRGFGTNALVCTRARALIAKRTELIHWSVGEFPYSRISSVEVIEGRPGAAVQVVLRPFGNEQANETGPFDDFPDTYFQESRRLVAPNTVMFRNRRRASEAVETLEALIAGAAHS
jgi:hypothetical protein